MSDQSRVPTDEEVVQAARAHYEAPTPTLGIAKLLAALQAEHGWSLSEKRFRKLLQTAGLRQGTPKQPWVPVSSVDESVPLPDGVAAKYFDEVKGRGLVATKPFAEGQSLFVEDAFLAAPPPSQLPRQLSGELCAHCFHPTSGSALAIACGTGKCGARFCNRICQGRAQSMHHALLCPGLNPNAEPLLKFLEQYQWHSLHNVARALARLLLTESAHPPPSVSPTTGATVHGLPTHDAKASFDETLRHLDAFATVSELERRARNPGWSMEKAMFLPAMRQAWELLCKALDPRQDKLPKRFPVQRAAFPAAALDRVFSYDAFLGMLGRTNINMESHGGLCTFCDSPRLGAQLPEPRLRAEPLDQACPGPRRHPGRDTHLGPGGAPDRAGRRAADLVRRPQPPGEPPPRAALARLLLRAVRLRTLHRRAARGRRRIRRGRRLKTRRQHLGGRGAGRAGLARARAAHLAGLLIGIGRPVARGTFPHRHDGRR